MIVDCVICGAEGVEGGTLDDGPEVCDTCGDLLVAQAARRKQDFSCPCCGAEPGFCVFS